MEHPRKRVGAKGALATALSLCLLILLTMACERGHNVTFRNESNEPVTIWRGVVEVTRLEPGAKETYSVSQFPGTTTYRITGEHGNTLFAETFTFEELRGYGDIVVPKASPTPSPL